MSDFNGEPFGGWEEEESGLDGVMNKTTLEKERHEASSDVCSQYEDFTGSLISQSY